jgi:uncharacterized protein
VPPPPQDFGSHGVRLLEVDKRGIAALPAIFDVVGQLPQKWIVFCDDLSFEEFGEGEQMRVAKAALEGSLRKYPSNVMFVMTSNRRFPVGSRNTDATEEKMAFTNRFAVVLAFPRLSRASYLNIARKLCEARSVVMVPAELDELALAWALGQDGNSSMSLSGRTARQFADHVSSVQALAELKGEEPGEYLASSNSRNSSAVPANSLWASSGEGAAVQQ